MKMNHKLSSTPSSSVRINNSQSQKDSDYFNEQMDQHQQFAISSVSEEAQCYLSKVRGVEKLEEEEELPQSQAQSQQIVLFKYKRPLHKECYDQIRVNTDNKKVKRDICHQQGEINQKQQQNGQGNLTDKIVDTQETLSKMFGGLSLSTNKGSSSDNRNSKKNSSSPFNGQFFLKRIDSSAQCQASSNQQQIVQQKAHKIFNQNRLKNRNKKLNNQRGINYSPSQQEAKYHIRNNPQSKIQKRIKYKVIDIKDENFADFNGKKYEYEDFSKEFTNCDKSPFSQSQQLQCRYDYYMLQKIDLSSRNKKLNRNGKYLTAAKTTSIILPQQAQYLLQRQSQQCIILDDSCPMQRQSDPDICSQDSNRSDRSAYDYPDQDYHQGDSGQGGSDEMDVDDNDDQDEGIIRGRGRGRGKFNHAYDSSDDDLHNSYNQEQQDEQEYYRQYLIRCKKYEQGDEDQDFLYKKTAIQYENGQIDSDNQQNF